MYPDPGSQDATVLMKIQNNKKPEQIIDVVLDRGKDRFKTYGLKNFFGVQEIAIDSSELLASLPEYAEVLSFLLETMSTAQNLRLPYSYQEKFTFGDAFYTLLDEGEYRALKRIRRDNGSFFPPGS